MTDEQIIEQEIPEADIYKRHWNINACKEYVKQLRDKTRANTAEHAAEAIEFLLAECDALHKEMAIKAIKEALAQPEPEPVQVSPIEFVEMVMEKEHLVGKPIIRAQWPNKE